MKDYLVFALLLAALYLASRELGLLDAFEPRIEPPPPLVTRSEPASAPVVAPAAAQAEPAPAAAAAAARVGAQPVESSGAPKSLAKPKKKKSSTHKRAAASSDAAEAELAAVQAQLEAEAASQESQGARAAPRLRKIDGEAGLAAHSARRVRTPDAVFVARYRGTAANELALAAVEIEQQLLREQGIAFERCFAAGEYDVQVISTPRGEQQMLRPAPDEPLQRVQAFSEGTATGVRIARLPFAQHPHVYELVDELDWLRRRSRQLARR